MPAGEAWRLLGVLAFSHVWLSRPLEGNWHFRHGSVGSVAASEGGTGCDVAGGDAGEAAVGERAAGGGVRERERGAGGSIQGPLD